MSELQCVGNILRSSLRGKQESQGTTLVPVNLRVPEIVSSTGTQLLSWSVVRTVLDILLNNDPIFKCSPGIHEL